MRKLREYRRLREVSWDKPTYDPESLLSAKRQRIRQMMAYKPYAVADLADILMKQDAEGKELTARLHERAAENDQRIEAAREERREELISLAKRARGGEIAKLESRIPDVTAQWNAAEGRRKLKLRKHLRKLQNLVKALAVAQESVKWNWWKLSWDVSDEEIKKNKVELGAPKYRRKGKRTYIVPPKEPKEWFVSLTDGVKIDWYNVKDAEYAAKWPDAVTHAQFDRPALLERSRHGHVRPTPNPAMVPAWNAAFKLAAQAAEHARVEGKEAVKQFIYKVMHRKHKHYKLTKAPGLTPALMLQNGKYKQIEPIKYKHAQEKSRDVVLRGRRYRLPIDIGGNDRHLQFA